MSILQDLMSEAKQSHNDYLQMIERDLQELFKGIPEHLLPRATQDFVFVNGPYPQIIQPLRHYKLSAGDITLDERWLVRKSDFDAAYTSPDRSPLEVR